MLFRSITNALAGKSLPIYGDGKNVRDWLFVKDHYNDFWLDWGLVKLDKPLGDRTGWFGLTWRSGDYQDTGVELRGYPYDKAPGELWGMGGTVAESRGNQLCYSMDTYPAQSGSPLYMSDGTLAIGIHAYGTVRGQQQPERKCPQEYNAGTRITKGL